MKFYQFFLFFIINKSTNSSISINSENINNLDIYEKAAKELLEIKTLHDIEHVYKNNNIKPGELADLIAAKNILQEQKEKNSYFYKLKVHFIFIILIMMTFQIFLTLLNLFIKKSSQKILQAPSYTPVPIQDQGGW
jgi:hypothetical protein